MTQSEKERGLRLQHHWRPVDHQHSSPRPNVVRGKLSQNQVTQTRFGPARLGQHVMRVREGVQPTDQIGLGLALRQRTLGDRRDDSE